MSECMLATQSDAPVRLAAASPEIVLGDPKANAAAAISAIRRAEKAEADYLVLPELFLCGATLGSLMEHPLMLNACREALGAVAEATKHTWLFVSIGLPYMVDGRVRSCIALLRGGRIYAVIPASRGAANPFGFAPAVPRGAASLSTLTPIPRLSVGFAGQIFAKGEPREGHIMLLSGAINATAKSYGAVRSSLAAYSARTGMAAAMALPSRGESTTAFVFDGYCAIAANGEILAESEPLSRDAFVYADVCIDKLSAFEPFTEAEEEGYVSSDPAKAHAQLRRLFALQRAALVRRAEHIHAKGFVIGVSGGLDSALALFLVLVLAVVSHNLAAFRWLRWAMYGLAVLRSLLDFLENGLLLRVCTAYPSRRLTGTAKAASVCTMLKWAAAILWVAGMFGAALVRAYVLGK